MSSSTTSTVVAYFDHSTWAFDAATVHRDQHTRRNSVDSSYSMPRRPTAVGEGLTSEVEQEYHDGCSRAAKKERDERVDRRTVACINKLHVAELLELKMGTREVLEELEMAQIAWDYERRGRRDGTFWEDEPDEMCSVEAMKMRGILQSEAEKKFGDREYYNDTELYAKIFGTKRWHREASSKERMYMRVSWWLIRNPVRTSTKRLYNFLRQPVRDIDVMCECRACQDAYH